MHTHTNINWEMGGLELTWHLRGDRSNTFCTIFNTRITLNVNCSYATKYVSLHECLFGAYFLGLFRLASAQRKSTSVSTKSPQHSRFLERHIVNTTNPRTRGKLSILYGFYILPSRQSWQGRHSTINHPSYQPKPIQDTRHGRGQTGQIWQIVSNRWCLITTHS